MDRRPFPCLSNPGRGREFRRALSMKTTRSEHRDSFFFQETEVLILDFLFFNVSEFLS